MEGTEVELQWVGIESRHGGARGGGGIGEEIVSQAHYAEVGVTIGGCRHLVREHVIRVVCRCNHGKPINALL